MTDRRVKWILFTERWRRATEPYIRIFKLAGEFARGRYWQPFKKVRSDPDPASGGGSGAAGQPVAQFTFNTGFAGTGQPATSSGGITQPPGFPPPVFEDAGIRAGEVVAYRNWILKDGILHSVFQRTFRWMPGEIVEGDAAGGDGIHAFKSVLLMAEYGAQTGGDIVVTGTVELWGEVYEHERGYRASKAAIKTIDNSHEYDAKALRRLYGLNRRRKNIK